MSHDLKDMEQCFMSRLDQLEVLLNHNVGKQFVKVHTFRIFVQRRKNADLQDSGLIYDHGDGVSLLTSELSVVMRSYGVGSFRPSVEAQPGNHLMEELGKMASAFLEIQLDAG